MHHPAQPAHVRLLGRLVVFVAVLAGMLGLGALHAAAAHASGTLTVTAGAGRVTSDPAGIDCGAGSPGDCSESYEDTPGDCTIINGKPFCAPDIPQQVTLTASTPTGYAFDGWSGACTGTSTTCAVTMRTSTSVTASFHDDVWPTVSVSVSPTGAWHFGTVAIQCTCSDVGSGLASVRFLADDAVIATDTSAPYAVSWNTTGGADGARTVEVRATDNSGKVTSRSITVNVDNHAPDEVALAAPADGAIVHDTVQLEGTGSDAGSGVVRYTFYRLPTDSLDETLIGTVSAPSSSVSWDTTTVPDGLYRLEVRAFDAVGNFRSTFRTTVRVANLPWNSEQPTVGGSTVVGATLTADAGTWSSDPTTYYYKWQRCASGTCSDIAGAAGFDDQGSSYTLTAADQGFQLRVWVGARNGHGTAWARSADSATVSAPPAPQSTSAPTVSGAAQVGSTLNADPGSWTNYPASFYYTWQRCRDGSCAYIDGAAGTGTAGKSYRIVSADLGYTLRVWVGARNGTGTTWAVSAATMAVTAPPAPENTAVPTIAGTAAVGQVLTASPGTWTGFPTRYFFSWRRCTSPSSCDVIGGGYGDAGTTYRLVDADRGFQILVWVQGSNDSGARWVRSELTDVVVASAPVVVEAPSMAGEAVAGSQLTASPGTWTGNPSYYYSWRRCDGSLSSCTLISGAQGAGKAAYALTDADVGSQLVVWVRAANELGTTWARSDLTDPVAASSTPRAPTNLTAPTIGGDLHAGQTLTASPGTWSGSPTGYYYQWRRCSGSAASCTLIAGAAGNDATTYTLTPEDVGHEILVWVRAGNDVGMTWVPSGLTGDVADVPT